jgi:hypothetical protein
VVWMGVVLFLFFLFFFFFFFFSSVELVLLPVFEKLCVGLFSQ